MSNLNSQYDQLVQAIVRGDPVQPDEANALLTAAGKDHAAAHFV